MSYNNHDNHRQRKLAKILGMAQRRISRRKNSRKSLYLWEFLFGLLEDDECSSVIEWKNKFQGVFEVKNTDELAKLWGTVKNRPNMDKFKLFRAMRTYYAKGLLKKIKGHQRIYQFLYTPFKLEGCAQEVVSPHEGSESASFDNSFEDHCSESPQGYIDNGEMMQSQVHTSLEPHGMAENLCGSSDNGFGEFNDCFPSGSCSSALCQSSSSSFEENWQMIMEVILQDVNQSTEVNY